MNSRSDDKTDKVKSYCDYMREYMRNYRKDDFNRERLNMLTHSRYHELKNDPAYQERRHKYRLTHFANYLRTFGYTVIPPEGKE